MPYPEAVVTPMREELARLGVEELRTAQDVDAALEAAREGTLMVVINSVCGCAAANARPAITLAMHTPIQPEKYATVFAGQDVEATARLREFMPGVPPSSPAFVLFKEGEPAFVVERRHIEGRSAGAIAADLSQAYNKFCGTEAGAEGGPEKPTVTDHPAEGALPPTFRSIL